MDKTKPNRMYEMMTNDSVGNWKVRVWTHADSFRMGPDIRVVDCLDQLKQEEDAGYFRTGVGPLDIADALDKLGKEVVMAYEILDPDRNGAVVYPDWK